MNIRQMESLLQKGVSSNAILDYLRLCHHFADDLTFSVDTMQQKLAIDTIRIARIRALQLVKFRLAERTHTSNPNGGRSFTYRLLPIPRG